MYKISVLGQKGGCGKTTLSINLARGFQIAGASVIVIDTDKQASSRDWYAQSEGKYFNVIAIDTATTLEKDIKALGNFDICIIDGTPKIKEMAVASIKLSDLVLLPIKPSPLDIWASSDFIELIKEIKLIKEKLKVAFIINMQNNKTKIKESVRETLDSTGFKCLKNSVAQRNDYIISLAQGITAYEMTSKAREEVVALINELQEFINE